jgi:hypothetical protein
MPAVKAIFLRMSATWKAFRIVESMVSRFRELGRQAERRPATGRF